MLFGCKIEILTVKEIEKELKSHCVRRTDK
jgi:hypothetical protein